MLSPNEHGPSTDLLDRVLADQSPEVKARVLEVVYRLGISPKDELFLVMLALGYLQVLIQDSPKEWEELFFDFKNELDQWTDSNLEILDSLVRKAETEAMLAKSSQQLVSVLTNLTSCSSLLMNEVKTLANGSRPSSSPASNSWESALRSVPQDLTALRNQGDHLSRTLSDLIQGLSDSHRQVRRLWLALGGAGILLVLLGWNLWGTVADTNQRVKWVLQQQINAECLAGRKTRTSPLCRGVLK